MALQDQRAPATQKSLVANFPPPVGGWNTRDAFPMMQQTDAVIATNVLCQPWQVVTRAGNVAWTTGYPQPVESLMGYNSATPGSRKLFAATTNSIYDSTTQGAIGAPVVTGLTSAWWQSVNFGTGAGTFLVAVNGADDMRTYNGAAWTATATLTLTGGGTVNTNTLISVSVYNQSLYFVPNNALGFYYEALAGTIFGNVTYFNLAPNAPRGGFLQAIATWTVDGGQGPQDYIVFITSEGEYIVYQGLSFTTAFGNPGAMNFVGSYYIARPLGRRCWMKYGGDCLVLTERGLFPLSKALQAATIDKTLALTDKIEPTFVELARQTSANNWQGWQVEQCQANQFLIVNVPTEEEQQLVMQFQSRAWSYWTGWHSNVFLYFNSVLYFADDASVNVGYTGGSDTAYGVTSNIVSTIMPAFSPLKNPVQQKHVKLIRPYIQVNGNLPGYTIGSAIDFNVYNITTTTESGITSAGTMIWGTSAWGSAAWGAAQSSSRQWHTILQYPCFAFAPYWQFNDSVGQKALTAYDILYALGGVL